MNERYESDRTAVGMWVGRRDRWMRDTDAAPLLWREERRSRVGQRMLRVALLAVAAHAIVRRRAGLGLVVALGLAAASDMLQARSPRTRKRDPTSAAHRMLQGPVSPPAPKTPRSQRMHDCKRDEAIFPRTYIDREGNILDGSAHYQIRGRMDMPSVWWSVTLYDEQFAFISNPEGRHSFTSFNTIPCEDGRTFVIDIAPEPPEGALNWLPSKRRETFNIVWRFYLPGAQILDDADGFELPEVVCVEK